MADEAFRHDDDDEVMIGGGGGEKSLYHDQEQREESMNLIWEGPNGINPKRIKLFHVRGIIGRNIYFRDDQIQRLYFTIHDNLSLMSEEEGQTLQASLIFTSEITPFPTASPNWREFRPSLPTEKFDCSSVTVCVWAELNNNDNVDNNNNVNNNDDDKDKYKSELVFKEVVDLTDLVFVSTSKGFVNVKYGDTHNMLFFCMEDGVYTRRCDTHLLSVESTSEGARKNEPRYKIADPVSYDIKTLTELINKQEQYAKVKKEHDELLSSINEKIQSKINYFTKLKRLNEAKARVLFLKQELERQTSELKSEEAPLLEEQKLFIERARQLEAAQALLVKSIEDYNAMKPLFNALVAELERVNKIIAVLQWRLVRDLRIPYEIAPYKPQETVANLMGSSSLGMPPASVLQQQKQPQDESSASTYAINGIPLADSAQFPSGCEDEVASALGSCCHLLSLMGRYLDVPMRYQMEVMGSRSSIYDENRLEKLPLYIKGADPDRFTRGVFFMNKNVEQILDAVGVPPDSLRKTLCNIHKVYVEASEKVKTTK